MCKAVEDICSTAVAESKVEDLINVMERFTVSLDDAMDALQIPVDQRDAYREMVKAAQQ